MRREFARHTISTPVNNQILAMPSTKRQPHLFWKAGLWGPIPTWTKSPDLSIIESLSRRYLSSIAPVLAVEFLGEGAFNKLYTIATPDRKAYVFRVSLPVEPFYKTVSEVATLAYIRQYTSIPVPEVIAYSATVDNELGFEWILMEKVPGVSLRDVWSSGMGEAAKEEVVKTVARYVSEMRGKCRFASIGSLYFRKTLEEEGADVHMVETGKKDFVVGPIVTTFFFVGGRRLMVRRDRGPYDNEHDYMRALTEVEIEDMKRLQSSTPPNDDDQVFEHDEDLFEDAPDIERATRELQDVIPALFSSSSTTFTLCHHDLSLANLIIEPDTYQIMGIVDWECVSVIPSWEDSYPQFLTGPELHVEREPEPLAEGEQNELLVEQWENWEKVRLRKVFDGVAGQSGGDESDNLKRQFRGQLDVVEVSTKMVDTWLTSYRERH
jgi:aminoglycoside phosphotransferase (APT) family kinase protein